MPYATLAHEQNTLITVIYVSFRSDENHGERPIQNPSGHVSEGIIDVSYLCCFSKKLWI